MKKKFKVILEPLISLVLAFLIGAIVILIIGKNPLEIYKIMLTGSVGNVKSVGTTLVKATVLIFTGLSYAFAAKCGLCNVGAEGQLYMGALFATIIGLNAASLPSVVAVPIALIAGFVGGGLLGALIGWLKVKFNANEVITTVMLNYIAQYIVSYLTTGPLMDPAGDSPQTAYISESTQLFVWLPGTTLHIGLFIAIMALVFYGIYLWKTKPGFEMQIVGRNNSAAAYSGINVKKNVMRAMVIAGGLGGLAGAIEIMGVEHRLMQDFSSSFGFDGIAVALLGNNNPVGIFLSAFLFGGLKNGGNAVQMFSSVPAAIVQIIQGLVIIFVLLNILRRVITKREETKANA